MSIINPYRFQTASQALPISTGGLEAWWNLDDEGVWADSSGNGRDLTDETGSITTLTSEGPDSSTAADFPNGGRLSITNANYDADFTGPYTVTFWYKPETISGTDVIFDNYVSGIALTIYRLNDDIVYHPFSAGTTGSANILLVGSWYFIAARRSASGINASYDLRWNATDGPTYVYAGDPHFNNTTTVALGGRTVTPSLDMDGKLQRISIWSRRLSDAELDSLYNNGNGVSYIQ